MVRILYGVSPIGLGHATRGVAVAERLRNLGAEVLFASGGQAFEFLRSYGFETQDIISEPVPNVRNGEMKGALAWYFRYWRGFGKSKRRVERLLSGWRPDLVVGDEEFTTVSLALERGINHVMIADELELGFAKTWLAKMAEARVSDWYERLQQRVSLLIIPDEGVDTRNKRYVGPIVRSRSKSRDEVIKEFALPNNGRLILLALSGSGLGSHLLDGATQAMRSITNSVLVVMGNRDRSVAGERVFDVGVVREGQDLIASVDLVISTAGKSTIDEAASFGTPIIVIPIKNHAEQERNASALGFGYEDLGRLGELVRAKMGRREVPRSFDGAERVSRIIAGLFP